MKSAGSAVVDGAKDVAGGAVSLINVDLSNVLNDLALDLKVDGTTGGSGGSGSIPTLINVNLQNVLNDLSVSLKVDRNSIPVTAQVPIDVAATVCGVSVDALASGTASCTATRTSAQLSQVVQQQISTGGSVTGGDQTTTVPPGNP